VTVRALRIAGWASAALFLAAMVVWGWDRGPDAFVDFGRELYVPWRLAEGDVLHRDIAWFNGPLAPWVLEAWMRAFGPTLDAVQALDAVVIALTALTLARLVERAAGGVAAWAAVVTFGGVFAVAQKSVGGNFLFLAPYSHGITFGFLGACAAVLAALRGVERDSRGAFLASGAAAGLVFLTKAEVTLGLGAALAAVACVEVVRRREGARRRAWVAAFAAGAALPIAAAGARFGVQLGSPSEAARALAGTWVHALDADVSGLPFYRAMRGTDDVARSLTRIAIATAGLVALAAAALGGAAVVGRRLTPSPTAATAGGLAFGAALTVGAFLFAPLQRSLLPIVAVLPAVVCAAGAHAIRTGDARSRALLALAALGLGLLPKVLLAPLERHYGFVLSLPGALVVVALLVRYAPARLGAGPARHAARAAALGVVGAYVLMNMNATRSAFEARTTELGEGADRVLVEGWRGNVLEAVRRDLHARLAPDDELLVLPEGVGLNHGLRRRTPTRVVNFMPPELIMFGEDAIVAELDANPPAAVVLVHRPTDVYGFPFIGDGYGERIVAWVRERYAPARRFGDAPLEAAGGGAFGAEIWLPRSDAGAPAPR